MKKKKAWEIFEVSISEIFELMGFEVQKDVIIQGRQTDIWLKSSDSLIGEVLVECKYHSDSKYNVSAEEAEKFIYRVSNLRSEGKINCGYLITNTNFTNKAKLVVKQSKLHNHIKLTTKEELLRNIINFKPYLLRLNGEYRKNTILGAQYEPLYGIAANSKKKFILDDELFKTATKDNKVNVTVITGDYGVGKTTTLAHLHWRLIENYLDNPHAERIPVYIPLKLYNEAGNTPSLILQFLSRNLPFAPGGWPSFMQINRSGNFVIILDGFDEMVKRASPEMKEACFRNLAELCVSNSKIFISGRSNYFRQHSELSDATALLKDYSSQETLRRLISEASNNKEYLSPPPVVKFVEIQPLEIDQIKSFLERRFKLKKDQNKSASKKVEDLVKKIESIYNLRELAERPILLDMIYATIGEIDNKKIGNVADLYSIYTKIWLKRELEKGEVRGLLNSDKRLLFSLNLACYILFDDDRGDFRNGVHYSKLAKYVQSYFGLDLTEDIDNFSSDIQTCTFLERDEEGYYFFAHKSFFEYFAARYIACNSGILDRDIIEGLKITIPDDVSLRRLEDDHPGIIHFLNYMFPFPISPRFWRQFEAILSKAIEELVEYRGWVVGNESLNQFGAHEMGGDTDFNEDRDESIYDLNYLDSISMCVADLAGGRYSINELDFVVSSVEKVKNFIVGLRKSKKNASPNIKQILTYFYSKGFLK